MNPPAPSADSGHRPFAKLRALSPSDLPQVVALERAIFPDPWSYDFFAAQLARPYAHFVAAHFPESPDIVVGYAGSWLIADEVQILNLAVDFVARRMGIGKMLLAHLLQHARISGATEAHLEVHHTNESALNLYRSFGFVPIGERAHYYGIGQTALLLRLSL